MGADRWHMQVMADRHEGMIDFKLFGSFALGQMVQVHVKYMKI